MQTHAAVMTILDRVIEESENPYLRSYKALPANILYKILDEFVKNHKTQIENGEFHIVLSLEMLTNRIEGAIKNYFLRDEVGLLIRHSASKTTIREITGVNNNEIVDRRKRMGVTSNSFGRPRILDSKEIELLKDLWGHDDLSPAMRVVSLSMQTGMGIDDIWNTVGNSARTTKRREKDARNVH